VTGFYRAFEDEHRGSRADIKRRLEVYIPFIAPLKKIYTDCKGLDIGCGRGEWLEILIENGFTAQGVDLDAGMLAACELLNLPALQTDALAFLKTLPDESLCVVSGFHIIEHINFDMLQDIVKETLRVLKPAGLMIFETPNSENIVVATENFYLDPTHERPVPKVLLTFLSEYEGFWRHKVVRLQENQNLYQENKIFDLMSVLGGVSPDYALIAQKSCAEDIGALFNDPFAREYGLSLSDLSAGYDQAIASNFTVLNQAIASNFTVLNQEIASSFTVLNQAIASSSTVLDQEVNAKFTVLNQAMNSNFVVLDKRVVSSFAILDRAVESNFFNLDKACVDVNSKIDALTHLVREQQAKNLQLHSLVERQGHQIQQLLNGWGRLTAPIRSIVNSTKKFVRFCVRTFKFLVRGLLRNLGVRCLKFKITKNILNRLLVANPKKFMQLKGLAIRLGLLEATGGTVDRSNTYMHDSGNVVEGDFVPEDLSGNAKGIFKKINEHMKRRED
jgi:SAM-dependent methyltransferase